MAQDQAVHLLLCTHIRACSHVGRDVMIAGDPGPLHLPHQSAERPPRWVGQTRDSLLVMETVAQAPDRSEEHTSELQSLMRISYAVFCLKKKKRTHYKTAHSHVI